MRRGLPADCTILPLSNGPGRNLTRAGRLAGAGGLISMRHGLRIEHFGLFRAISCAPTREPILVYFHVFRQTAAIPDLPALNARRLRWLLRAMVAGALIAARRFKWE